jgi:hypothetical protein
MLKLVNILKKSILNETVQKPLGCRKYPTSSSEYKLCVQLNSSTYRGMVTPILMGVLDNKKRKWNEVIPEQEQDLIFKVLGRLKDLDPNRKWQWPSPNPKGRFQTGTIDEFIQNRLPELSFIYDLENNSQWSPINKLDTNYSDAALLITDIIFQSKSFSADDILQELLNNETSKLNSVLNTIEKYGDVIYDKFLKNPEVYTQNSVFNSKQGEDVEGYVIDTLIKDGWSLIHRGGGGDPIDVLLGIDAIMEKGGNIATIQCKKVWNIQYEPTTLMNPNEGAYKLTGQPYISKQKNLDFVGYGTDSGEVVVAKRQKEVIRQGNQYVYTDKMKLPSPQGKSKYFYIDKSSVITTSINL